MAHLVVGDVLIDGGRILLAHRRPDRRYYPNCWDVLGGHIELAEDPEAALIRELREEAGIEAAVIGAPALHVEDDPLRDDGLILDVWVVTTWSGDVTNLAPDEHDALRWVSLDELPHLRLAHPAYSPFLLDLLRAASASG